jgi:uncharacterized protein
VDDDRRGDQRLVQEPALREVRGPSGHDSFVGAAFRRARIDAVESPREPHVPDTLQEPFRSALVAAVDAWIRDLGERVVSIVLFGSVARGQARPGSDIDVLVVAEGLPRSLAERRGPLLQAWERARTSRGLPHVDWNLVTKSPEEARIRVPLYLDIVVDGILIVDRDAFFATVLSGMRQRMRELGSRRVHLPDGSWYWDLKPDFRFGEIVEI